MPQPPPQLDRLIAHAGTLAHQLANAHAGTPASLTFDTIARNVDRLVEALPEGPGEAVPISDALCAMWGPRTEPQTDSDEGRLAKLLDEVRAALVAWRRDLPPPPNTTYFPIDPSRPTPRGPDISYECLMCGDVIPSIEDAKGPWHCRCYSIALDFDMHRASFRDATTARGIRSSAPPTFTDLDRTDHPDNGKPVPDAVTTRELLRRTISSGPSAFQLEYGDGTDLTVAVYPPLVCLQFSDSDAIARVAVPARPEYVDGDFQVSVGGTATPLERRLFMPLDEAEPLVIYFVEMGRMSPVAKWEAV